MWVIDAYVPFQHYTFIYSKHELWSIILNDGTQMHQRNGFLSAKCLMSGLLVMCRDWLNDPWEWYTGILGAEKKIRVQIAFLCVYSQLTVLRSCSYAVLFLYCCIYPAALSHLLKKSVILQTWISFHYDCPTIKILIFSQKSLSLSLFSLPQWPWACFISKNCESHTLFLFLLWFFLFQTIISTFSLLALRA